MFARRKTQVGLVASGVLAAVTLACAAPAMADQQPRSTDAVGVGSDTVQYVSDFVDDGQGITAGYNAVNTARRIWSFDATADASGRAAYNTAGTALNPTVVLRAGQKPVPRPNGSGAGITALLGDTGATHQINFVRSSRLPSVGEQNTASTASGFGGGIHVYQIATDGLDIATSSSTHVPALSATDLVNIYDGNYQTWSDVPGYTGAFGSSQIIPVIPQTGSGTRNDFIADLTKANGGASFTLASDVVTGEEHDPSAIVNSASPADTLEPFSTGRYNLLQSGYLGTAPAIKLSTSGTPTSGGSVYHLGRSLYVLVREADVNATTPFQTGTSSNLVQSLFGPSGWYAKSANKALFTAAGVTQAYADLGDAHS